MLHNRKARFRFEILETLEAGIVLSGSEVKSLRAGGADPGDAYASIDGTEIYLVNFHIPPYAHASSFNHQQDRKRKLLLKKREIQDMKSKVNEKRLTLLPLKIYFNSKGYVKILLGLGRSKKKYDKRHDQKKAEADREIQRALKKRTLYN